MSEKPLIQVLDSTLTGTQQVWINEKITVMEEMSRGVLVGIPFRDFYYTWPGCFSSPERLQGALGQAIVRIKRKWQTTPKGMKVASVSIDPPNGLVHILFVHPTFQPIQPGGKYQERLIQVWDGKQAE